MKSLIPPNLQNLLFIVFCWYFPSIKKYFSCPRLLPQSNDFPDGKSSNCGKGKPDPYTIWLSHGGNNPNKRRTSDNQPGYGEGILFINGRWTEVDFNYLVELEQEKYGRIQRKISTRISPMKLSTYRGTQLDPFSHLISCLPEELMITIFSRLPAKSLTRFKCVNKSLYTLVNNILFVDMHYDYWSKLEGFKTLMLGQDTEFQIGTVNPKGGSFKWKAMGIHEHDNLELVGLSRGLICMTLKKDLRYGYEFLVMNPALKESKITCISKVGNGFASLGFGWCIKDRDFRIVKVEHRSSSEFRPYTVVNIYSLYADSWKEVAYQKISTRLVSHTAIYLCDCLYWISNGGKELTIFNLSIETFSIIPAPGSVESQCLKIHLYDQKSIAATIYDPTDKSYWIWLTSPSESPEKTFIWRKHSLLLPKKLNEDYRIGHYSESLEPVSKIKHFFPCSRKRLIDAFWIRILTTVL